MKIFSYITIILALGLIVFNTTKIDIEAPLEGSSQVAVICIVAALCAIAILIIFLQSKKIVSKLNQ